MQGACATLSSVACPAYKIFPQFLINGTLKINVTEHKMYILILSTVQRLSETFLTLTRNERDMTQNVYWSSSTLYSCPILMKLEYSRQIFEKTCCSMRTDGRT
jgi:hypothetical protein